MPIANKINVFSFFVFLILINEWLKLIFNPSKYKKNSYTKSTREGNLFYKKLKNNYLKLIEPIVNICFFWDIEFFSDEVFFILNRSGFYIFVSGNLFGRQIEFQKCTKLYFSLYDFGMYLLYFF